MNDAPSRDRNRRGRRIILAASSSTQNVKTLTQLLQRFEYEVAAAGDAAQAQQQASALHPSLIIVDLVLPDMSGLEFFTLLQQDRSVYSIPVVFMVAASDAAAESRCLDYGAAGCITKPVQAEDLYRTVQAVLERRPRANIRIDTRLPVSVSNVPVDCPGGECLIDLSEQGMYVPTHAPFQGRGKVAVHLHIRDRTIAAEGAVLYSQAAGSGRRRGPGIGLKFTAMAPQDRDFIRKYIREEVMRGISSAPESRW